MNQLHHGTKLRTSAGAAGPRVPTGDPVVSSAPELERRQRRLGALDAVTSTDVHGAVIVSTTVPPFDNATLTIALGWYFPHKNFAADIYPIGNFYTTIHQSAADAAASIAAKDTLVNITKSIAAWHDTLFSASSLPDWLADTLVNSLSFWRSWFVTVDGRWRQWEA